MKLRSVLRMTMLGFMVVLASNSFAQKGSLAVNDAVMVNGTELPAGDYKVRWEGNGDDGQVKFMKHGQVMATSPAHVVRLARESPYDAAVLRETGQDEASLTGVRFLFKKKALELGNGNEGEAMNAGR